MYVKFGGLGQESGRDRNPQNTVDDDPNNSFTNDRSESDNDSSQEENRDAVTSPNTTRFLYMLL